MKKNLNLSTITIFVIASMGCQFAIASPIQPEHMIADSNGNGVIILQNGLKVREMTNNQQRSLYQIALLSSISVAELREINAGRYDKKDIVEVGERLVLPDNSPLLPKLAKTDTSKQDKYNYLPKLGSDDNYDVKKDKDAVSTQIASVLQTLASEDWQEESVSDKLKNRGRNYAENYVRSSVKGQLIEPLRNAAQNFLGKFGTAQLQFDVSDKGQFSNVNVKLFSPWYDSDSTLIFSQLTFQEYEEGRRIGNFGIGQRWDVADNKWLLGYNVFFDHDFQRSHNRLGLGVEAWSDYMKLSANYYYPLSDWKNSRDFDDYLERAAKGFDVRFQGYLPQYPQLGGSLMYEQYFGDKVGLFGKDHLQKDPRAITVGLDYTPVPLFTLKAEHKFGQDSNKTTKASLTMNYRIGVPLKDQLDPDMVQVARSLKGSRYDLVDRNNYIVLEYKEKKMSVDLGLSALQVIEGQSIPVSVGLHNAKGVSKISWIGDAALSGQEFNFLCNKASGNSCSSSISQANTSVTDIQNWWVVAPSYLSATGERNPTSGSQKGTSKYTFAVTVTDSRSKTATSNTVTFEVLPNYDSRLVTLTPIVNGAATSSGANVNVGNTVTLQGQLMMNGQGFNDQSVFDSYNTTITQAFIDSLNSTDNPVWLATDANGNRIPFGFNNTCPTGTSACLYVTEIKKDASSGDIYTIDVVASASLGAVSFTLSLSPYSSVSTSVNFTGGLAAYVDIIHVVKNANGDAITHELVATIGDSSVSKGTNQDIFPTISAEISEDKLKLGDSYYAIAKDLTGNEIDRDNVTYQWSLVSDKAEYTCNLTGDFKVDSDAQTSADNFGNSIYSTTYPTKYIPKSLENASLLSGENKQARINCAGDQGYKLKITATTK